MANTTINYKEYSIEALQNALKEAQQQAADLAYDNATATLPNTNVIKAARRTVARIKTEIRARELATSTQPRDRIIARRRRS
jgi:large subunit ribosomal protein L29